MESGNNNFIISKLMLSLFNSYLKIVNFDNIQHSQLLKLTGIFLLYVHLLHLKFFMIVVVVDCWLVIRKEKSEGSIQRVNWYEQGNISKGLIDCSLNTTLIHLHTPNTSKIFTHLTNRPFPSCCEPHYESEAKCKTFHMKIGLVCI